MEEKDIDLVMQQANVSRAKVRMKSKVFSNVCIVSLRVVFLMFQSVKALKNNTNDIVNAIMVRKLSFDKVPTTLEKIYVQKLKLWRTHLLIFVWY